MTKAVYQEIHCPVEGCGHVVLAKFNTVAKKQEDVLLKDIVFQCRAMHTLSVPATKKETMKEELDKEEIELKV